MRPSSPRAAVRGVLACRMSNDADEVQRKDYVAFIAIRDGVELRSLIRIPLAIGTILGSLVLSFYIGIELSLGAETIAIVGLALGAGTLYGLARLVPQKERPHPAVLWFGDGVLVFRPQGSNDEYTLSNGPLTKSGRSLISYSIGLEDGTALLVPKRYTPVDAARAAKLMPKKTNDIRLGVFLNFEHEKLVLGCALKSRHSQHSSFSAFEWPESMPEIPKSQVGSRD